MKKNHAVAAFVLVACSSVYLAYWNASAGVSQASTYTVNTTNHAGDDSLHYFDALLGYKKIPKMPIRNIFAEKEAPEKKASGIVSHRPLVAPLVKPAVKVKKKVSSSSLPRLIGIVIRDTESRAFFVGDKFYTVSKGDTVAGRYRITAIQPEKVQVVDKSTGTRQTIRMKN